MADALKDLDRYLLITSDSHAGPDHRQYKPYLDKKWRDEFDLWVREVDEWQIEMQSVMGPRSIAVGGDMELDGSRNWDTARRLKETEADGVVAEVIFSNTSPPFSPRMLSEFGEPEAGSQHERRWAGIRAHNRWLADFCREMPGRRAGVVQIFLPNIKGSVEEIRWAKENGLTGGVLLPGAPPGSGLAPLYAPEYEPIWAVCEELGMPLNHHAGAALPDFGRYLPQSMAMYILEVKWWGHRALWHLMFSGVFERYPELQFVLTEVGVDWVPGVLKELDHFYSQMKYESRTSEHIFGGPAVANMSLTPSEYFDRQCHLGASFLPPKECDARREIGTHKIMWGSDYPHIEGSYPYTREHLRLSFDDVPEAEIQQMLATNAARVYGFDLEALAPIAARIGPTKAEIAEPLDLGKLPDEAHECPAFAATNQRRTIL
ncbi:MAG: amidohydrolase [Deltaproteobacteria bacterium]|nr:amidohydrolase [Deltaproteobacteria bacterium]